MSVSDLTKRSLLVAITVATGSFLVVYLLNDWFHQRMLPALGLPLPLGDAIGASLIVVGFSLSWWVFFGVSPTYLSKLQLIQKMDFLLR